MAFALPVMKALVYLVSARCKAYISCQMAGSAGQESLDIETLQEGSYLEIGSWTNITMLFLESNSPLCLPGIMAVIGSWDMVLQGYYGATLTKPAREEVPSSDHHL